jgi:tetratricopeptide (TPR) repeat protein
VPLLLVACDDYSAVQEADTIEAYEKYIAENPDSGYSGQVNARLDELYYKAAETEKTLAAWDRYLEKYPEGRRRKEADEAREVLLYEEAVATNTPEGWKRFLEAYPKAEKTRRKKAESALRVFEYADKLTIAAPIVAKVNLAEDPAGELNGWGFKVDVTNNGDKTLEYVMMTLEYLGSDDSVLGRQEWPVVSNYWNIPIEEEHQTPMKPGDMRTWEWSTGLDGVPEGWAEKVRIHPTGLRYGEETAAVP